MKPSAFGQSARLFFSFLFAVLFLQTVSANKITKQSGDWNAPSTWEGNVVPDNTEGVVIQLGHTVTRTGSFSSFSFLINYGTLVYSGLWTRVFLSSASISNAGTIRIEGGTTNVWTWVTGTGTIRQTGGTTTFSDAYGMGTTDLQGGQVNFTAITNDPIATNHLILKNTTLNIASPPALSVYESMSWRNLGRLLTGSQIQIEAGATLTFEGGNSKQYNDGTILNHGTMYSGGGDIDRFSESGNIYNYSVWEIDVPANASGYVEHQTVVNADGEIRKKGAGSVIFSATSLYADYALPKFQVQQGTASLVANSTPTELDGQWIVDAGATLSIGAADGNTNFVPVNTYKFINNGTVLGRIKFQGGNTTILEGNGKYERLEVDGAGTEVKLSGSPEITAELKLTTGKIILYQYDLRLGSALLSATGVYDSYIMTNGLGSLVRTCPVGYPVFFPVGKGDFAQFTVKLAAGSTPDNVSVRVNDQFYTEYNGITPACTDEIPVGVVAHTWFVNEQTPGGSIAEVSAHWLTTAERSGFDQTNCTLGRYVGGNWQPTGFTPAYFGGPSSSIQRDNITFFGLFGVFDAWHEADVNFDAPTPTANGPLCEWSTLQLQSNTSAAVNWSGPNGFQSNLQNPSIPGVQAGQSGLYTVEVSQYGCTPQQASVDVEIYAEPNPVITGPDEIQPGEPATLTANDGTSYLWSTGETSPSITVWPDQTTDYQVTVSNGADCSAIAQHTVAVVLISASNEAAGGIKQLTLAPNPATDATLLTVETGRTGDALLSITDVQGVELSRQVVLLTAGTNRLTVSLAGKPVGTYYVTLLRDNEGKTVRVVKM